MCNAEIGCFCKRQPFLCIVGACSADQSTHGGGELICWVGAHNHRQCCYLPAALNLRWSGRIGVRLSPEKPIPWADAVRMLNPLRKRRLNATEKATPYKVRQRERHTHTVILYGHCGVQCLCAAATRHVLSQCDSIKLLKVGVSIIKLSRLDRATVIRRGLDRSMLALIC